MLQPVSLTAKRFGKALNTPKFGSLKGYNKMIQYNLVYNYTHVGIDVFGCNIQEKGLTAVVEVGT